ncbi:MAG: tetratricopeptide repeat protein [Alphaproteobacteria bacterium]|nr:tetratricopeptide repeat protein [Alphaproteobacteria bacterium]
MTLKATLHEIDALLEQGACEDALRRCDALLDVNAQNIAVWTRRGAALLALDRAKDARRAFNKALNEDPTSGAAWNGLGKSFFDLGDLSAAIDAFGHAAAIFDTLGPGAEAANESASARYHQSMALLATGDFAAGWPAHEARLGVTRMGFQGPTPPLWTGQPLAGKRLLVLFEQGYGDMIQFARYLPRLRSLDCKLVVSMPADLIPLLSPLAPNATFITMEEGRSNTVDADFSVWLMSLPNRLGAQTISDIPAEIPYIAPPAGTPIEAPLNEAFPQSNDLSIGLVWAGRPSHPQDHQRSIDSRLLAPLFDIPGVRFYGLQKEGAPDITLTSRFAHDWSNALTSFSATAAILARLDLIITVDTAVAHLAGAMGRPVWLMLPFAADWRWLRDRDDSPWYPTMRLFRQNRPGDWHPVIDVIGKALTELSAPS